MYELEACGTDRREGDWERLRRGRRSSLELSMQGVLGKCAGLAGSKVSGYVRMLGTYNCMVACRSVGWLRILSLHGHKRAVGLPEVLPPSRSTAHGGAEEGWVASGAGLATILHLVPVLLGAMGEGFDDAVFSGFKTRTTGLWPAGTVGWGWRQCTHAHIHVEWMGLCPCTRNLQP